MIKSALAITIMQFGVFAIAGELAVKTVDGKTVKVSESEIVKAAGELGLVQQSPIISYSSVRQTTLSNQFFGSTSNFIFSNIKVLSADKSFYPMVASGETLKLLCRALGFVNAGESGGYVPDEKSQIKFVTFLGGDVRVYSGEDIQLLSTLTCYR